MLHFMPLHLLYDVFLGHTAVVITILVLNDYVLFNNHFLLLFLQLQMRIACSWQNQYVFYPT